MGMSLLPISPEPYSSCRGLFSESQSAPRCLVTAWVVPTQGSVRSTPGQHQKNLHILLSLFLVLDLLFTSLVTSDKEPALIFFIFFSFSYIHT